jgi:predicted dithiol-disulfide oxidoreductase (DUF899 family)
MIKSEQQDVRKQISDLDQELMQKREKLTQLRLKLPSEEVKDHALKNWDGKSVKLSQLFGKHDELIVIHNMGASCAYCTLWADGFNGIVDHLNDRAAFVVVTPDAPSAQKKFAESRGWRFKMLSNEGSNFIQEMGFVKVEDGKNHWQPGFSTFHKDAAGKITRVAYDYFGPGDVYSSPWHLFALLKKGVNNWEPKYHYNK